MLHLLNGRPWALAGAAIAALASFLVALASASAQSGAPIKIGYSMALTGGLAPNGKSALLAQKIWEEDINAKGGLLGRPVKLVYYDDKSAPAEVPAIYTKLLDVDKVDLLIGAYATAQLAPAMPVVIARKKLLVGLLGLAVNSEFDYPNYFAMIPSGPVPKPAFTKDFFALAMLQNPKPQTVAIVAADQEFSKNASDGARDTAQSLGLKIVYDKTYPPSTTDFSPIVRAIQATNPDLVVVCSYPPDSVGIVRAANEIGLKPKMIGGAMVGLQATAIKTAARAVAQRLDQLRFLAAGAEDEVPGHRGAVEGVSIEGAGGRCRSARLLIQEQPPTTGPAQRRTTPPMRMRSRQFTRTSRFALAREKPCRGQPADCCGDE